MAKFTHSEFEKAARPPRSSEDGKTVFLNGKETVSLGIASANVHIEMEDGGKKSYPSSRAVITAPHGAKLLPYFMRDKKCFVVMVEQFRIALPGKTLEAAGGEADTKDICGEMARELEEEARITVNPDSIKVAYEAYIQPSMMASKAYGGIVRIKESQLPKELLAGEGQFGEYTVLSVKPLSELLNARASREIIFDLETWILLDAVAEAVCYYERMY